MLVTEHNRLAKCFDLLGHEYYDGLKDVDRYKDDAEAGLEEEPKGDIAPQLHDLAPQLP